jgi:hypothetical protein
VRPPPCDRAIPCNGRHRVGLDAAHDAAEPRQAWLAGIDDDHGIVTEDFLGEPAGPGRG